jgi:hypothetical protein
VGLTWTTAVSGNPTIALAGAASVALYAPPPAASSAAAASKTTASLTACICVVYTTPGTGVPVQPPTDGCQTRL